MLLFATDALRLPAPALRIVARGRAQASPAAASCAPPGVRHAVVVSMLPPPPAPVDPACPASCVPRVASIAATLFALLGPAAVVGIAHCSRAWLAAAERGGTLWRAALSVALSSTTARLPHAPLQPPAMLPRAAAAALLRLLSAHTAPPAPLAAFGAGSRPLWQRACAAARAHVCGTAAANATALLAPDVRWTALPAPSEHAAGALRALGASYSLSVLRAARACGAGEGGAVVLLLCHALGSAWAWAPADEPLRWRGVLPDALRPSEQLAGAWQAGAAVCVAVVASRAAPHPVVWLEVPAGEPQLSERQRQLQQLCHSRAHEQHAAAGGLALLVRATVLRTTGAMLRARMALAASDECSA